MSKTPVLILTHRRLHEFKLVFDRVKASGARQIYVFCDGPRDIAEERAQRAIFDYTRSGDEHAGVCTNFQRTNLGLRRAVITGIDWFFANEESGIILEDDTLPTDQFFSFCDKGLGRYRGDSEVQQISGYNSVSRFFSVFLPSNTNFFSPRMNCWGWATWRDRWQDFRPNVAFESATHTALHGPKGLEQELRAGHERAAAGDVNSWAYSWAYYALSKGLLSLVPSVNMVENIGFGAQASNTKQGASAKTRSQRTDTKYPTENKISERFALLEHVQARLQRIRFRVQKRSKKIFAWLSVVLRRVTWGTLVRKQSN